VRYPFHLDDEDLLYAFLRKITPHEEEAKKLLAYCLLHDSELACGAFSGNAPGE
jgi:hypothetical protein